ncbi:hypothetical protein GMES_0573 [Paraglaciecola mesophila KMM 241]|uniref:Uncharacterized protein n=1 Tax=Paraglaciecola mesophila KMM 241 TaxID=1128912 RepID=K6XQI2_9ALTE|nr:hypothetical protein GMES_0573 [Paraglaciecola mesophila KMM 241]
MQWVYAPSSKIVINISLLQISAACDYMLRVSDDNIMARQYKAGHFSYKITR